MLIITKKIFVKTLHNNNSTAMHTNNDNNHNNNKICGKHMHNNNSTAMHINNDNNHNNNKIFVLTNMHKKIIEQQCMLIMLIIIKTK